MNTGSQHVQHPLQQHGRHCDRRGHAEGGKTTDKRRLDRADAAGMGAAEARVPPTIVTTVTMTNDVVPPMASILAHNASTMPRVVVAQPSAMSARRLGSRVISPKSLSTSLSRGRTAVANQRRSLGTNKMRRQGPAPRWQPGTGSWPTVRMRQVGRCARGGAEEDEQRDIGDPLHRLLQCDRRGGAQSARPFFCRNLVHSARPPTPGRVVVAANVWARCEGCPLRNPLQLLTAPVTLVTYCL
jgi:hypothetical protein